VKEYEYEKEEAKVIWKKMEARKVAKRVLTRKKKALRQVERHTRQAH
jgi:hypothetical protein